MMLPEPLYLQTSASGLLTYEVAENGDGWYITADICPSYPVYFMAEQKDSHKQEKPPVKTYHQLACSSLTASTRAHG